MGVRPLPERAGQPIEEPARLHDSCSNARKKFLELIAYCGRWVDQTQPRYRLPSGFAKSEILFNMHRAAAGMESSVVVVEGFFDCIRVQYQGCIRL